MTHTELQRAVDLAATEAQCPFHVEGTALRLVPIAYGRLEALLDVVKEMIEDDFNPTEEHWDSLERAYRRIVEART